jgi:hypothetical protein
MKNDPWQEALDSGGGIQGSLLKFVKGVWSVDDDAVETGEDGIRLNILMETAQHGSVLWGNDRTIIHRRLQRYADAPPSKESLKAGWAPYTQVRCIGASGIYSGQMMTFSSSSWGARHAFFTLIHPYMLRRKLEFPICTLGSRPKKNDVNGNFDPVFTIVGWAPRVDFAAILPPDDEPPPSSATAGPDDDDDDTPF